ncbi:glycoside hydrolase [Pelomyxa schiedti]|nr:glycoside hydrolase [Pelomyxa schiedti]
MRTHYSYSITSCLILIVTTLLMSGTRAQASSKYVTYIDSLTSWWPPTAIAASMGVPTYAPASAYNVINLAFWTSNAGPVDAAMVWAHPINYVSTDNPWGQTDEEVRAAWLELYHSANISLIVSAFGATDFPTSEGTNAVTVATNLAQFIIDTNADGVDLDYEDNDAMNQGKGEDWVIQCTQTLRSLLPATKIITHAPQAPYFMGTPTYPKGGYITVSNSVGASINCVSGGCVHNAKFDLKCYSDAVFQ